MQKPVIILGIDPGTLVMGYSVVEASKNIFTIKTLDVLKLSSKKDHYQRLQLVHQKITELADEFKPNEFAIEAPFFGKNVQSMLKLGRAQGVAIAAAMTRNIPVTEYSPRKIKQAITGNGNADKDQVWKMLQRITSLPDKPKYYDATDALAVAICHFYGSNAVASKKTTGAKKASGWEKFIQENPSRLSKVR
ncbi:MAG: crossover junction endodeoxyribonuclease RuvC [Flavisolibacter sp.]